MVRDADDVRSQVDVCVHHAYITYITRTSCIHCVRIVHTLHVCHCTSLVDVKGVVGQRYGGGSVRESGKSEKRSGGKAESERGKAERSGNVGKRSSQKGVPLTETTLNATSARENVGNTKGLRRFSTLKGLGAVSGFIYV